MKIYNWPDKDPTDILDYQLNQAQRIAGDTITSSTFTVVTGDITVSSSSFSNTVTKVWLSGGVENQNCKVNNLISTSAGRTMSQTVNIRIKTR